MSYRSSEMDFTSPSTGSSGTGKSPELQFRVVRKRNRVPLSCAPCRHRKLKCNRGHPCDNCTRRGDNTSCTYAAPSVRKKSHSSSTLSTTPDEMQTRIDRLEGLVLSLITSTEQSGGTTRTANKALAQAAGSDESQTEEGLDCDGDCLKDQDESEVDDIAESVGVMKVDNDKPTFASEVHWYAILSEIAEVKTYFTEHKKQFNDQLKRVTEMACLKEKPGSAFLLKTGLSAERSTVSLAFPPKVVADLLIEKYFNSYDPGVHIIHGPTFQKQYDKHWANPTETRFMWYGLAYSMMTLALQSYNQLREEPPELRGKPALELSAQYRHLTAQCLMLEDYTNPSTNTIETIILHLQAESGRSKDCESGIIIIVGILVKLAYRMGYHRDSKPYATISPFQGEMRRRVWAYVRAADILFSYQAGHPSIIRPCNTDTALPGNFYDDELEEDMRAFPMPKPVAEATPTSFMIARGKLLESIGRIDEYSLSLTMTNYDEVMKLDESLQEARAALPSFFKMTQSQPPANDPPQLHLQRIILDLLYLKGQCILHRKFLGKARMNARFNYSRQTCVDAALAVVAHQVTLHKETKPRGKFIRIAWYNASLNGNSFVVAAIIIVLDLYNTIESELRGKILSTDDDLYVWSLDRRAAMFEALQNAVGIWEDLRNVSIEAWKAHTAISIMLGKLRAYSKKQQQQRQQIPGQMQHVPDEANKVAPERSAASTLGILSAGGMTNKTANGPTSYNGNQNQAMQEQDNHGPPLFSQTQEGEPVFCKMRAEINKQQQQQQQQQQQKQQQQQQQQQQPVFAADGLQWPLSLPDLAANGMDTTADFDFDWSTWDSFLYGSMGLDSTSSTFWPSNIEGGSSNGSSNNNNNLDNYYNSSATNYQYNNIASSNDTGMTNGSIEEHNNPAFQKFPQLVQPQQQQQVQQNQNLPPLSSAHPGFLHGLLGFEVNSHGSSGSQGPPL